MFSSRFLSYFKSEIVIIKQYYQKKCYSPSTSADLKKKFLRGEERISLFTSASLTVEAAMILPIFLFALSCLIMIGQIIQIQTRLQNALEMTAEKVASYSYAEELVRENVNGLNSIIAEWIIDGITFAAVKNEIIELAGKNYLDHSCLKDGSDGLYLIGSTISTEKEFVDIVLSYKIRAPIPIFFDNQLWITQRSRRRLWIGSKKAEEKVEVLVYVTVNGSVYHTNMDCSYLKRTIRSVSYESIRTERNESGGKYYDCEFCTKGIMGAVVYITNYGDRYHFRTTCPGLSRGIRSLPLSQVNNLPQCKKCMQKN